MSQYNRKVIIQLSSRLKSISDTHIFKSVVNSGGRTRRIGRSIVTKLIVNVPPVMVALVNMFISDRGFLDKVVLTFETWQEGPFDRDSF